MVVALMTLEALLLVIGGGVPDAGSRPDFLRWMMGGLLWILFVCLDLVTIVGLLARSAWGWWLTVTLWSFRTAAVFYGLLLVLMDDRSLDAVRQAGFLVFVFNAAPVVLLVLCRARGAYLPRLAGERADEAVPHTPTRTSRACKVCGDPCPPVDNPWTREGLCSKKCKDRESSS